MKCALLVAALLAAACGGDTAPSTSAGSAPGAAQALRDAAFAGDTNGLKTLIDQGVDVNAPNENLQTSLMLASFEGHTPAVKLLLDSGADVKAQDMNQRTALVYASSGASPATVEVLLAGGGEVGTQDVEGWTPLMVAASEGQAENVKGAAALRRQPRHARRRWRRCGDVRQE